MTEVGRGNSDKLRIRVVTVCFAACSSCMLIVNKLAVKVLPAPSVLLFFQLLSTTLSIACLSASQIVQLQRFELKFAAPYSLVAVAFLAALYTNIKTLQYANIETFIVFRSSTPLLISVLDYICLGRELPSLRSTVCLIVLLLGSVVYVGTDSHFQVVAYKWVVCWYVVFCFDQIFIKHVVDSVKLSTWDRSLYTNSFALVPVLIVCFLKGEHAYFTQYLWTMTCATPVILSCILGFCMSLASFHLRSMVSATYFTVLGTLCKILSVLINFFIWDEHASAVGIVSLFVCIASASFYEQAPMRIIVK